MNNKLTNLSKWQELHPKMNAIVRISSENPDFGYIIAESNNKRIIEQTFLEFTHDKSVKIIPTS